MIKRILMCIFGTSIFILSINGFGQNKKIEEKNLQSFCRCQPNQSCWPSAKDWAALATSLTGHLTQPRSLMAACKIDVNSIDCKTSLKNMHNPLFIESDPSGTHSQGWMGAWKSEVSEYAVEAETTKDVAVAINFARKHKLKLVIKGTGHDYLGRSNGSRSLLIWTHKMRQITFHPSFIPAGCSPHYKVTPAITVGAGTRWLEAYDEATNKHNLYVQGGGCTTVGVAGGFTQGGGFGSFSKKFGTGAAGILQVEVVTANGAVVIANQCQNQDLFWAIRGGGAGTFGVVTKMTLKLHPLPKSFGIYQGTIRAKNDEAYKKLLQQFLIFFRQNLNNEHWGEQFLFDAKNTINILMLFQDLNKNQIDKIWLPLESWIRKKSDLYSMQSNIIMIPPRNMWDPLFWEKYHPEFITLNSHPGASKGEFWWRSDSRQVSEYWYSYQSWWLPIKLFKDPQINQLAEIIFKASRFAHVGFHINKGLSGAAAEAINQTRKTATNPIVYDAPVLVIIAGGNTNVFPEVKAYEVNQEEGQAVFQNINKAMQFFIQAVPDSGAYVNEADYFQQDWQKVFWGNHYAKLFAIKQKYDPTGLFYCHHCVGSERWTEDGMCQK